MFAIPHIFLLVFIIISGQIADRIRSKQILSTTATRRWQTVIGIFKELPRNEYLFVL
jgi:hypothetical protein